MTPGHVAWRRFLARQLDLVLEAVALGAAALAFAPGLLDVLAEAPRIALPSALLLATLPLEVAFLATSGTTPGKALLGLRMRDAQGAALGRRAALVRSLRVALRGQGLGIPFLAPFCWLAERRALVERGCTSWDAAGGVRVEALPLGRGRMAAAAAALAFAVGALSVALGAPDLESRLRLSAEAREALAQWRSNTERLASEGGGELAAIGIPHTGLLPTGREESLDYTLGAGTQVVATVAGDAEAGGVGLHVFGPDGTELAHAEGIDPLPMVSFRTRLAGRHVVTVQMLDCPNRSCGYAVQVFDAARLPTDLLASDGTCFAVAGDGTLLTAYHVVAGYESVAVTFPDEATEWTAKVVKALPDLDLALLHVPRPTPGWLPLARGPLRLGEHVFTIGFPATDLLGVGAKFSEGSISALRADDADPHLMQVSVPFQPGSSGGPVVDERGELVGVASSTADEGAFYEQTGAYPQNVNWAVRAELVRALLPAGEPPPAAADRAAAIARVEAAVCRVVGR